MQKESILYLTIPMQPVPKARPRVVGKHTYTPKRTKDAQAIIATYVSSKYKGDILTCAMGIKAVFVHKRPKNLKGSERIPKHTRPDGDNLVKTLTDAMEGIVYKNDGQICFWYIEDWYAKPNENPGIELELYKIIQ
jgi:Holliday junction resolvase RusA-like endonuclease